MTINKKSKKLILPKILIVVIIFAACLILLVLISKVNFRIIKETKVVNSIATFTPPSISISPTTNPTITSYSSISIDNSSGYNLILVNPLNKIPDDYIPILAELENGYLVDERVVKQLQEMLGAARLEGLSPIICSAYRSIEKQEKLYENRVIKFIDDGFSKHEAISKTSSIIAIPYTSEHHTGLAVDIVASSYQRLNKEQENTAEQKWLIANSYKYGFILRYPSSKSDITGIQYEPWHYRYVGNEVAKMIYNDDLCFEEYLDKYN